MIMNNLTAISSSLEYPQKANVLLNGAIDLNIVRHMFSPELDYTYYVNSSLRELNDFDFRETIEFLKEEGYNIKRTSRSDSREKKVITPKSFSFILDFGHGNTQFHYALSSGINRSDRFDNNKTLPFNLLEQQERLLQERKSQLSSIRGSLAAGLISSDDVPKNILPYLNSSDEELEQEALLEALKNRNSHIADARHLIRELSYMKQSSYGIATFSSILKDEGVYLYFSTPWSMDAEISFPMTRSLDDVKAFMFNSDIADIPQNEDYIVGLIGTKRKKEKVQVNTLGSTLGAFFAEDPALLLDYDKIDGLYEKLKNIFETLEKGSKEFVHYSYLINALYHTEEEPLKKRVIPSTLEDDVQVFRIGTMTIEELNEASSFERLVNNYRELEELNQTKFSGYSPTALHDGHIALLLTSGLLNSYVGKGEDQHLIKGTTYKSLVSLSSTQEERKSIESYTIELVTLNRDGVFKTIL